MLAELQCDQPISDDQHPEFNGSNPCDAGLGPGEACLPICLACQCPVWLCIWSAGGGRVWSHQSPQLGTVCHRRDP